MSRAGLDALRARVNDDPELARRLHRLDRERFAAEVVLVAAELGCDVVEPDLHDAIGAARQAWMLRWVR